MPTCGRLIGNGISRVMEDCRDGCPRLRSVDEESLMNEELDNYFPYRRKSTIK